MDCHLSLGTSRQVQYVVTGDDTNIYQREAEPKRQSAMSVFWKDDLLLRLERLRSVDRELKPTF